MHVRPESPAILVVRPRPVSPHADEADNHDSRERHRPILEIHVVDETHHLAIELAHG